MINKPLVSIITPVYNGANYLDDLIQSVLKQDYPFIEHIIIDDGSNDNGATIAVLRKYPHLRWWSRENKGQYFTMNEGFEFAQGEVVTFISADDMFIIPYAVRNAIQGLFSHPSESIIYGKKITIDENGKELPVQPLIQHGPMWLYKYTGFISHCTLFIKKDFLIKHGLTFNEKLLYNGDFDWIIRIINYKKYILFLDQNLCCIRHHEKQTTVKEKTKIMQERKTIMKDYQINKWIYWFINQTLIWIYRLLKAKFSLQTEGLNGFKNSYINWRKKQRE